MRDRAFGVEIECGYNGEGECSCRCECYTCEFCESGCTESLGEDELCSCECACDTCYFCEYGCECDRDHYGCEVAADLLSNAGFSEWLYEIHEDGSGVEIPSPVLRGRDGLNELRRVCELLNSNGFYTEYDDGGHVHHDAPEFVNDESLVEVLVDLWKANERQIDPFVHYSRRSVERHWACEGLSEHRIATFKENKTKGSLGRMSALNITALDEHGTVEIRQHEGTLDFDEWRTWIQFGQAFLDLAVQVHKRGRIVTCQSPSELLRTAGISPKATRTLLMKAANERSMAYA